MSDLTKARELKERIRQLSARHAEILAGAEAEDRDLNAEEEAEWGRIHDEQESLAKRAKRHVEHHDRESDLNDRIGVDDQVRAGRADTVDDGGDGDGGPRELRKRQVRAMENVFCNDFEQDDLQVMRDMGFRVKSDGKAIGMKLGNSRMATSAALARRQLVDRAITRADYDRIMAEARAMSTSAGAGGDTIPETLVGMIERQLLAFGGMREAGARVIRTATGEPYDIPTDDDTGQIGALLAENTQAGAQDITTGQKTLNAYKYTSKVLLVSRELLQDTAVDLPTYIGEALGERIGRITNQHLTTGSGSGQPNGVVTAAGAGVTAGAATTVSYDELVDLQHSVDPAYRAQDARFMFSDATLKALKKLKDGDGKPLWVSGLTMREPDTILGDPYTINQDVADIAASAKSIVYGAFRYYWIRDVLDIVLLRLDERYADYFQVGWVAFSRHDGELVSQSAGPLKYLQQSA